MTPPAIANTGWKIYLLFCVMLILSIPFTYFLLPEVRSSMLLSSSQTGLTLLPQTSGKTLEEIDFIFAKGTQGASAIAAQHSSISNRSISNSEEGKGTGHVEVALAA